MIINEHKGEFMCRKLAALNAVGGAEHAQWILLKTSLYVNEHKGEFMYREHCDASVKTSLYVNEHKGEFMCREHCDASVNSGESCALL